MARPTIRIPIPEVSPSGSGASIPVNQDAHGFSVGDPIYFDGADWVLAQADLADHLHIGVVSEVTDSANCIVALAGEITGLSGLTPGAWYYLDQSMAGAVTSTEPTTGIKASVYQATSATTAAVVPYIPQKSSETSSTVVDVSLTDSDLTAVVGKHYRINPSGMTADRNFILPAGADLQEVSFELAADAPADYELIIKGDTGVSVRLRQADAVTADEVTRCFIRGEAMRFVHDGTDWVCNARDDGRIPSSASLIDDSGATIANATPTKITFVEADAQNKVIGGIFDDTNDNIVIRRAGAYLCGITAVYWGALDTNQAANIRLKDSINDTFAFDGNWAMNTNRDICLAVSVSKNMPSGYTFAMYAEQYSGGNYTFNTTSAPPSMYVIEQL